MVCPALVEYITRSSQYTSICEEGKGYKSSVSETNDEFSELIAPGQETR